MVEAIVYREQKLKRSGAQPIKGDFAITDREEEKKHCRVCGESVPGFYRNNGGRRCVACLHRTHGRHLSSNNRTCLACREEELFIPPDYLKTPPKVTVLHVADTHFGRQNLSGRIDILVNWLAGKDMDYILFSGDMTGGAGREEFLRAARWVRALENSGVRVAAVPGNHDIGYWGNAASLMGQAAGRKYQRWSLYMDRPVEPCIRGPGCLIIGLNSAHGPSPTRFLGGYVNRDQLARAREVLQATPVDHLKIVFCHHPLVRFEEGFHRAVAGSEWLRNELSSAGADLLLWGHQHNFAAEEIMCPRNRCFAVQSPTLSARTRGGDLPGFTVIEWHFAKKLVVRPFRITDSSQVEEGPVAETVFFS